MDKLKQNIPAVAALAIGVAGIWYSRNAKSNADKDKRKPFMYVGIIAALYGAYSLFTKFKK